MKNTRNYLKSTRNNTESSDPDYGIIWNRFNGRCVRCNAPAVTIHEIHFRSEGKASMNIENRIPLCASCHFWAHERDKKNRQAELISCKNRITDNG